MQMYNPEFNKQDGSGPASPWFVDVNMPGASQIQYIGKVITGRKLETFYTRVPAQEVIIGSAGEFPHGGIFFLFLLPCTPFVLYLSI